MDFHASDGLNLYQLRVLAAIVEHGSVTGAAEALGLTQPAISAQVRNLRRFARAPVLVRDGRKVVLSEAGRALYRFAEEMLGASEALRREIEDISGGERDHILIAGPLAYVAYVLPPVLSRFRQQHANLHLSVIETSSRDAIERVRSGRTDIGVVSARRNPNDLINGLVVGHLFDDEMVIIDSVANPQFECHQKVTLKDLTEASFIGLVRGEAVTEAVLNRLLATSGLPPIKPVMEFSAWAGVKDAVRSGAGIALVLKAVIQRELQRAELKLVDVEDFQTFRPVDLICSPERRGYRMSKVFDELLAYLLQEVGPAVAPSSTVAG